MPNSMAGPPDATMVLFAEKSTVVNRDPNEFGIADTGLKQRALLPSTREIELHSRTSMVRYSP